jgi:membrane protein implicated in regulation of membrane protease activity
MMDSDVFLMIGIVALAAFLIQTVVSLVMGGDHGHDGGHGASMDHGGGLGHDGADHGMDHGGDGRGDHAGHADSDGHHDAWAFLKFFSIRNLVSFALGYGWIGYASLKTGLPGIVAVLLGLAGGVGFVYAVYLLMRGLHSLEEDGAIRLEDAIGRTGEVYLEIDDDSPGKINLKLGGANQEMTAVHAHPGRLDRGTLVRVLAVEGSRFIVEKA